MKNGSSSYRNEHAAPSGLVEEKSIFCYNCGSELDNSANAKFCALCGTSIQ